MIVILKPILSCNLRCGHCYVGGRRSKRSVLPVGEARQILAEIPSGSEVILHGGEPTLLGLDYLKAITTGFDKINFSMQTNLTLIDESFIPFIRNRLGGRISTSFDVFDSSRHINPSLWMEKIRLLQKNRINPFVVSLLYRGNGRRGRGIYHFFKDRGLSFRLNVMENLGRAKPHFLTLRHSQGEYARAIKEIFDLWFMKPQEGIIADPCAEILSFFILGNSTLKCPFTSKCAFHFISINPDGDVLPCGGYDDLPEFSYGNLFERSLSEILRSSSRLGLERRGLDLPEKCFDCRYFSLCNGGCPLEALSFYGERKRETSLCREYKEIFEHIERRIEKERGDIADWWLSLLEGRKKG
jgi:uncharacterized protein